MNEEIFDFFEAETEDNSLSTLNHEPTLPLEFGIDFNEGQLTGDIVEGSEAIKVWAWLALKTERYKFRQFSWNYGCEINDLIGTQFSEEYTKAQAKTMIEDCLLINKYITGITNFECKFTQDRLKVEFTIVTDFGEEEVKIDV